MTTTTRSELLTFDGPLHVAVAALGAGALLWLIVWSLRRERAVLGARCTVLFIALRGAALLVALWMLLAPAMIRSDKSQTLKSVAVVVDVSPSMLTRDPPLPADDARWALAARSEPAQQDGPIRVLVSADRALAAATLAEHWLSAATSSIRSQQPERAAVMAAVTAHDAVHRTRAHVQAIADQLDKRPSLPPSPRQVSDQTAPSDTNRRVGTTSDAPGPRAAVEQQTAQILQILAGGDFEQLGTLVHHFQRGYDSLPPGWRERLVDIQHQASRVRDRLAELTRQIAVDGATAGSGLDTAALEASRSGSRLERVAGVVESLDDSLWGTLRDRVVVRHAVFDSRLTSLSPGRELRAALREATERDAAHQDGATVRAGDEPPFTDLTAALEALRRLQQEQPLAAVLLFTDAAHTRPDGRDPRAAAAELSGSPVFVVPIGNTRHVRDVDLKAISAPGVVMKDDEVVIEATVQAFECEGEVARIQLLRGGEIVQERDVPLASAIATQRVRFHTQLDDTGLQRFQVQVVPLKGELSDENNLGHFEVNVTRDHINVLLADEMPRWEFRYLAQLFRRDAKVSCDELLFQPRALATGRRAASYGFPSTVDEWDQYDVVVLGDVSGEHLSVAAQETLAGYVRERGGTLVMIAGGEFLPQSYVHQPLEELLPVTKVGDAGAKGAVGGYAFQVTDDGWQHDALMIADTQDSTRLAWDFINRNSPLSYLSPYRRARPAARTLITALPRAADAADADPTQSALLCWQPVGRGRVVYLASPETYRLRFLRGDRLHYRFWGQLLRWAIAADLASGTQSVSIRTDRPDYRLGSSVEVVVRLADETGNAVAHGEVQAVAVRQDGSRSTIPLQADASEPGRYVGSFDQLPTGIYRVEPDGPEVQRLIAAGAGTVAGESTAVGSFTVRAPPSREVLDTRCDRALAQHIADATGGQLLPPTAVPEVLALTNLDPIITESTVVLPLWVQWKYLWIVFACLFAEWSIRKRLGLS